jgi:hypothetical protein
MSGSLLLQSFSLCEFSTSQLPQLVNWSETLNCYFGNKAARSSMFFS